MRALPVGPCLAYLSFEKNGTAVPGSAASARSRLRPPYTALQPITVGRGRRPSFCHAVADHEHRLPHQNHCQVAMSTGL